MKIVFRVDGGYKIGMGHISRCITLAKYIRSVSSAQIIFITKNFKPSIDWIKQSGFSVYRLSQKDDLRSDAGATLAILGTERESVLITDIPQMKERYLEYLKGYQNKSKLVCFDSFGIKKAIPDILVNPTIVKEWYPRWKGRNGTKCFFGPAYWILDNTYMYYHSKPKEIKKKAKDILISLGGAETSNFTMKIINSILAIDENLGITAVIGPAFKKAKNLSALFRKSGQKKVIIKEKVADLARLMFAADIGIISGGFTLYEAACVGLPCLVFCKVPHQVKTADEFEELGIAKLIGPLVKFKKSTLRNEFERLAASQAIRQKMSRNGKELVDGRGTQRVWRIINNSLRKL